MATHLYPELKQKLSRLKLEERKVNYRNFWRSLLVCGFVGTMFSLAMSPSWRINSLEQFQLKGDRLVSKDAVYDVLKIATQDILGESDKVLSTKNPPLWTVDSEALTSQLSKIPALQAVRVNKTLFPPAVKIYIQERIPVATAISNQKVGFLDYRGVWLNPNWYRPQSKEYPLTKIKVINFQPSYQATWAEIYSLINAYPNIEVQEVQWQENGVLTLKTKHLQAVLGTKNELLAQQFAALASFTDLAEEKDLTEFSQIDLRNPDSLFLNR